MIDKHKIFINEDTLPVDSIVSEHAVNGPLSFLFYYVLMIDILGLVARYYIISVQLVVDHMTVGSQSVSQVDEFAVDIILLPVGYIIR